MKISRWTSSALLVAILGAFGCNGSNTITGIDSGAGSREAAGASSATKTLSSTSLSGPWTGTITFYGYNDRDSDPFPSPCAGARSLTVALSQVGNSLSGQFASCAGTLEIHGGVSGESIFGTLQSTTGLGYGKINGTVSSSRIQFQTTQTVADNDDDGDTTFMSTRVDLHRLQLSARTPPLVVDRVLSPRVLGTRR